MCTNGLRLLVLISIFATVIALPLSAQPGDRIEVAGQQIFMSGGNVAWVNYARDIGPVPTNFDQFEQIFRDVQEYGGNTMRLWLHTNGTSTPQWESGMVVGPGQGALDDLKQILDLAQLFDVNLKLCLWSFDMLQGVDSQWELTREVVDRNTRLLTDESTLQAYIDNALIPMVEAVKGHPAVGAWEIFNEPEGMTSYGWTPNTVDMSDIQWFVNRTAGAIRRADPDTPITNGSWNIRVMTDIGSFHNYYRDDRLVAAGGDEDGVLDFYSVHYYSQHFGEDQSPFHNDADHWELDKPIVVAEFWPTEQRGVQPEVLYTTLYDRGYAGALGWAWSAGSQIWQPKLDNMASLRDHAPDAVAFSISDQVMARLSVFPERILSGEQAELTWFSRGADAVTINGQPVSLHGKMEVTATDTTLYKLVARGPEERADTAYATLYVVPEEAFDRAFGKPAFGSSTDGGGRTADKAVDGNPNTRWSSNYGPGVGYDQEWMYVDLLASYDVTRLVLDWEAAFGSGYDIQVSHDAVQWHTVFEERNGTGGVDEIVLDEPAPARYVRMQGVERGTQWGYSLWAFEVYGLRSGEQPPSVLLELVPDEHRVDTGTDLVLSAVVEQGSHAIEQVRFYVNDDPVGVVDQQPWRVNWTAGEPDEYSLSAVVSDGVFELYSRPVSLVVQPVPETVWYEVSDAITGGSVVIEQDASAPNGFYARLGQDGTLRWPSMQVAEAQTYDVRIGYRLLSDEPAELRLRRLPVVNLAVELAGQEGEWLYADVQDVRFVAGTNNLVFRNSGAEVDIAWVAVRGEGQTPTFARDGASEVPDRLALHQNYPNPFNPSTLIAFDLPQAGLVRLQVYDLLGRRVHTLVDAPLSAGSHKAVFDASRLSSGVYVYRLQAGEMVLSRQMMLVK